MKSQTPFNFLEWIAENEPNLKPPVCNKELFPMGDFIIMVVGGPNSRKDYHDDAGEEFFYQIKGHMILRIMEDGKPRDIRIDEGEMYLLPAHVPHSPQRFEDTVGLVIERRRTMNELDGFIWFCDVCHHKLYEEYLPLRNIVKDLPPVFARFWDDEAHRTCKECGHIMPPKA